MTPETLAEFLKLGIPGVLALGLIAVFSGRARVGSLVDKDVAERKEREIRLVAERDLAYSRLDRIADALETILKVKVPE